MIDEIMEHAEESFPKECCGLVLKDNTVLPMANMAEDPTSNFKIDPGQLVPYLPKLQAVYHSHPNGPASPSEADVAACNALGKPFLIVSYPRGDVVLQEPAYDGR